MPQNPQPMPRQIRILLFLWLASCVLLPAQQQYYTALLHTNPDCVEIQDESLIAWGSVDNGIIMLEQFAAGEDGYVEFRFENLATSDHIRIQLQESGNPNTYYQFLFSSNQVRVEDHQATSFSLPASTQRSQNIFRLERCGGKIGVV